MGSSLLRMSPNSCACQARLMGLCSASPGLRPAPALAPLPARPLPRGSSAAPHPPGSTRSASCLCRPEVVQPQLDVHLPGVQGQRAREQQDGHDGLEAEPGHRVAPGGGGGGEERNLFSTEGRRPVHVPLGQASRQHLPPARLQHLPPEPRPRWPWAQMDTRRSRGSRQRPTRVSGGPGSSAPTPRPGCSR